MIKQFELFSNLITFPHLFLLHWVTISCAHTTNTWWWGHTIENQDSNIVSTSFYSTYCHCQSKPENINSSASKESSQILYRFPRAKIETISNVSLFRFTCCRYTFFYLSSNHLLSGLSSAHLFKFYFLCCLQSNLNLRQERIKKIHEIFPLLFYTLLLFVHRRITITLLPSFFASSHILYLTSTSIRIS